MKLEIRYALTALVLAALGCTSVANLFSDSPGEAGLSLIINEIGPAGTSGAAAWVELANISEEPSALAGRTLTDFDGNTFQLPEGAARLEAGQFALILFDGQGGAVEQQDGVMVVHTPEDLVDPFEPAGDQLGLFAGAEVSAGELLHFVAWGEVPAGDEDLAVEAGLWDPGAFVNAESGGEIQGASQPGASLGVYPELDPRLLDNWVVYQEAQATPGMANVLPAPNVLLPVSGAELLQQDFRLAWYSVPHAAQYELQLATSEDFHEPQVEVTVEEALYQPVDVPAAGDYFWRVRAQSEEGGWSDYAPPARVTVLQAEELTLPAPPVEEDNPFATLFSTAHQAKPAQMDEGQGAVWQVDYLNTLAPLLQRKDSDMICWDGDDETGARRPWDGPHADTPGNHSRHGRNYCARASIAMINHYYGGDLSQDRITYQHFGGDGWPIQDLGHDRPLTIAAGRDLLSWSLNGAGVNLTMGKPTFQQIQQWTREGRAVMAGVPGHAIVLRGWAIYNGTNPTIPAGTQFVVYNDPWDGLMHVQTYASLQLTNTRVPAGAPNGRAEEASVSQDSEGDGIVDFDETQRFRTDPNKQDTDDDCVMDQEDMHSYLYTNHNQYTPTNTDIDNDGLWSQEDPDNDGGGVIDGNEDRNFNGHLDAGETNNFDASDDRAGGPCSPAGQPAPTATSGVSLPEPTATPTEAPTPIPTATESPVYGTYQVTISIFSDPDGHAPFVNMPSQLELTVTSGSVVISGPAPWVEVMGDLAEDGDFEATGSGTVAGFPSVGVVFDGRVRNGALEGRYRMGAGGELPGGRPIEFEVTGERQSQGQPAGLEDQVAALDAFAARFNQAFSSSDADVLFDMLHPAVSERYGAQACQAYLQSVVTRPTELEAVSIEGPAPWVWQMDSRSTTFEAAYSAEVVLTAAGEANQQVMHLVAMDDGSLAWFTDCGEPLDG